MAICFSAKKNCYAPTLSYGEICVGCGCCAELSPERDERRYRYWLDDNERNENFNQWLEGVEELQRKNQTKNRKFIGRRLRYYSLKVQRNRLFQPDYETMWGNEVVL